MTGVTSRPQTGRVPDGVREDFTGEVQVTWDNRVFAALADMREAGLWDQADTLSRELLACYAEITALERRLETYREASLNHRPPQRTTPPSKSLTSG